MKRQIATLAAFVMIVIFAAACKDGSQPNPSVSRPIGDYSCQTGEWKGADDVLGSAVARHAVTLMGHSDAPEDARFSPYRAVIQFNVPGLQSEDTPGVVFNDPGENPHLGYFKLGTPPIPTNRETYQVNMGVGKGRFVVVGFVLRAKDHRHVILPTQIEKEYKLGDDPTIDQKFGSVPSC